MADYVEIFGKDWAQVLKPFLQSKDWKNILAELKKQKELYPDTDDIFKAFKSCPYTELTTVFLTTNPHTIESDGLALSSKNADIMIDYPKVLDVIFDAVEEDVADGLYLNREPDLWRWANQGVLLLSCNLTTLKGDLKAHISLWMPFIKYVLKYLFENNNLVYVLIGDHAQKIEKLISLKTNKVFTVEHPMVAMKEKRPWNYKNIFSQINEILYHRPIDWTTAFNSWDAGIPNVKHKKIEKWGS